MQPGHHPRYCPPVLLPGNRSEPWAFAADLQGLLQEYGDAALALSMFEEAYEVDWPAGLERRFVFLFARMFIQATDMFGRRLRQLQDRYPSSSDDIDDAFRTALPELRGVRNSIQHADERSLGLGSGRRPIVPGPVETPAIRSSGGAMFQDVLEDDWYGCTLEDGTFGRIQVARRTLDLLHGFVQRAVALGTWSGTPEPWPRARR